MEIVLSSISENAEERLAKVVAQLVREGVRFKVEEKDNDYHIVFNGGF